MEDKEHLRKKQFNKISERLRNVAVEVDALRGGNTKKLGIAPLPVVEEKVGWNTEDVARKLDVSASQVLFWISEFEELKPKKKQKGERLFTEKEIEALGLIDFCLKIKKYTLTQTQNLFKTKADRLNLEKEKKLFDSLINLKDFLVGLKKIL
ncbi:MAG: MerR family transcriptional regulator [Bacteroidia bacterium]